MEKITKRQEDVLNYIKKYVVDHGFPPSTREIGAALGLSSPATVHTHLKKLEDAGCIRKTNSKFRTIEIVGDNEYAKKDEELVKVPLLGTVSCGNPIEAIEVPYELISLPSYLIPKKKEVFTLKVDGTSMINAGIYDGDNILIEQTKDVENGDMVVALLEDSATVKTFYKEDGHIRLQPENDTMDPIIVDDCEILGKVFGVFRFFNKQ